MAITQLNYSPGIYEVITDEALDGLPVLNTWYYLKIDGWSHVISDIVLKQGGTPLPGAAYELTVDTKYTDREVNESGKTLYAKWRIVNGTYDLIATTVSGNNFGTYVDNETVKSKLAALPAADVSYDNTSSGLTAIDVQDAIDEVYSMVCPVGGIIAWHKSFANTPTLPANFLECNGQVISDANSVYNGQTLPDLNGDGRFLRGDSISGPEQADASQGHLHAMSGASVSGTNGLRDAASAGTPWQGVAKGPVAGGRIAVDGPVSDGVNGTPRTASETRPVNMSVVWIIRIK